MTVMSSHCLLSKRIQESIYKEDARSKGNHRPTRPIKNYVWTNKILNKKRYPLIKWRPPRGEVSVTHVILTGDVLRPQAIWTH